MCMCLSACFPGGSDDPPVMRETQVPSPGRQDPLEKGIATHSSILAWRIPETEEPQPWSHKESDMTEQLTLSLFTYILKNFQL